MVAQENNVGVLSGTLTVTHTKVFFTPSGISPESPVNSKRGSTSLQGHPGDFLALLLLMYGHTKNPLHASLLHCSETLLEPQQKKRPAAFQHDKSVHLASRDVPSENQNFRGLIC